jgi:hypothetical protein
MKKHLFTILTIILIIPAIQAEDFYFNITQTQSVSEIQVGIQNAIDGAVAGDRILVTGSKTDADITLVISIPQGKTVVWQATYQSGAIFEGDYLLYFWQDGTFEVAAGKLFTENAHTLATFDSGSIIVSGSGIVESAGVGKHTIWAEKKVEIKENAQVIGASVEVIYSEADDAIITVSGGSVIATPTAENAICTMGRDAKIYISGGYVSNDASVNAPTIIAYDPRPFSWALVHVSGSGKVEAKGMSCAIISYGFVRMSDNAQVSNNFGGNDVSTATIRCHQTVEINDNAKVTALNNYTILCDGVTVSGNSIIEAKENAIAIYSTSNQFGSIDVMDKAQIIAAHNYAISNNTRLSIEGGVAFAYGNDILDVLSKPNFTGPINEGIVLAWNIEASHTNYEMYSTDDIFKLPESATAYWDKKGSQCGISYANGENKGFIPLDVTVELSVSESMLPDVSIYPNPTTGELRIAVSDERYAVSGTEIFDIYGRKQKAESRRQNGESRIVMDISELQIGVYFVRITTEHGAVMKKVVKW